MCASPRRTVHGDARASTLLALLPRPPRCAPTPPAGILLADGSNGPFKLELQYMRALRHWKPEEHAGVSAQLMAQNRAQLEALSTQAAETKAEHGMSREDLRRFYREQREEARLKLK